MMNYYEILGIPHTANLNDIKKAYHKLALKWHPDKNQNNSDCTEMFRKISEAYEVLSDPSKRDHYDRFGTDRQTFRNHNHHFSFVFRDPAEIFREFFSPFFEDSFHVHSEEPRESDESNFFDFFHTNIFRQSNTSEGDESNRTHHVYVRIFLQRLLFSVQNCIFFVISVLRFR